MLALDADRAGREAMLRAQGVASGKRLRLRVARMPEGEDPADLLGGGDQGAARAFPRCDRGGGGPAVLPRADAARRRRPGIAGGRDRALDEVVQVIAVMPDSITREELMREVADRLDADPGLVARRVGEAGQVAARTSSRAEAVQDADPGPEGAPAEAPAPLSARGTARAGAASDVRRLPAEGRGCLERLTPEHFSNAVGGRARDWLPEHLDDPIEGLARDDEELLAFVTQIVMVAEREPASAEAIEINRLRAGARPDRPSHRRHRRRGRPGPSGAAEGNGLS